MFVICLLVTFVLRKFHTNLHNKLFFEKKLFFYRKKIILDFSKFKFSKFKFQHFNFNISISTFQFQHYLSSRRTRFYHFPSPRPECFIVFSLAIYFLSIFYPFFPNHFSPTATTYRTPSEFLKKKNFEKIFFFKKIFF